MPTNKLIPLLLLLASGAIRADVIGAEIGINVWAQEIDARARKGGDFIDFNSTFDIDDESDFQVYFALEHPLPLIPNFRIQHTEISTDGNGFIALTSFDGVDFEGPVAGVLDLTHTDVVAYYEILDNVISVDLGLAARKFDARVELVSDAGDRAEADVDEYLPLLYSAVRVDLPLTGWHLKAEGNYVAWDGDALLDVKAALGWETVIGLGAEVGYRYFEIDYSFGSTVLDTRSQGIYGGLFWDF